MSFNLCVDSLCRAAGQDVPKEPVVWTLPSEILRQLRADPRGAALPGSLGIALEELLTAHAKLAALEEPIKAVCDAFGRGCTAAVMGDTEDIRAAGSKIVDAVGHLHGAVKRLSDPRVTRDTVPEAVSCPDCGGEGCFWLKTECICGAVEGCDTCEGSGKVASPSGSENIPVCDELRVWNGDAIELGPKTPEPPRPLARVSQEDYAGKPLWYVWLDVSVDTTPRVTQGLTYGEAADLANKINARGAEQKVTP